VVVVLAVFSGAGPSASAAGLSSLGGSTALEFAEAFADDIGADNGPAVAFVVAWEASEGSSASHNNPLLPLRVVLLRDAHQRAPRSMGDAKVQTAARSTNQGVGLA
jgi:hypothetical protein